MHSYKTENLTIQYNSDYSGDCVIIDNKTNTEITARCEEIMGFAAKAIRDSIISRIEDMTDKDILSGKGRIII
ncbi:hypothetical protein [Bacteroides acidifaciens]|uniref:hypothetical protein n=1 Tax=Bacteroides acidifaciens TaxID=85831 RepID=UPI00263A4D27|nr:hypothetical protein [Bacteroides acidifaciens]